MKIREHRRRMPGDLVAGAEGGGGSGRGETKVGDETELVMHATANLLGYKSDIKICYFDNP
jgi:hypothetical protein